MKFQTFSPRQLMTLGWWNKNKYKSYDAIICDGSIRSGKTLSMSIGFVLWSMSEFTGQRFAICGKTIESLRRNVILPMLTWLEDIFTVIERRSENAIIISGGGHENKYFLFGGRDESSYMLIQGITLAGVFFDEAALMPRSFVEQALGRCSVEGSKYWFNCNPESPSHWFYQEWILDPKKEKNRLHLHFTMSDNYSLSSQIIARYENMFKGVFYERYILGHWVIANGRIYSMFTNANLYDDSQRPKGLEYIAVRTIALDYGTTNPCVFLDIYDDGQTLWIDREYRWDSRAEQKQKTDKEYGEDMSEFMGKDEQFNCGIVADPSAASFIVELRGRGFSVTAANNEVSDGIRAVSTMLARGNIRIHTSCKGLISEMQSYAWDEKAAILHGEERPVKQTDHAPDALRYFVMTNLPKWRINA